MTSHRHDYQILVKKDLFEISYSDDEFWEVLPDIDLCNQIGTNNDISKYISHSKQDILGRINFS